MSRSRQFPAIACSLLGSVLGVGAVAAVAAVAPAVAGAHTVEVHWSTLGTGGYKRAGDFTSDFSPSDADNGAWDLLPTSGPPELGFIKLAHTQSGKVEVHLDALSGPVYKRVGDWRSDFSPADAGNGVWELFGSANGAPELGFIKLDQTQSGTVEVHVDALSGSIYKRVGDWRSEFSPADAGNGVWELFGSANGAPELGFIKLAHTQSGTVEVHWDTLQSGGYKRAGDFTTDFSPADAGNGVWQLFGSASGAPELGFIKLDQTQSGTVEVHVDALSGDAYKRVGSWTSDFSPADASNGAWRLFGSANNAPELGLVKTFPPPPAPPPPPPPPPVPVVEPVAQRQVLPVPVSEPRRRSEGRTHGRVRAGFSIGWTWDRGRTRLRTIRAAGLPRHARLQIRCAGKGCPDGGAAAGVRGIGGLLASLVGHRFRAGDRLTITVSAPRKAPERIAIRIRYGKLPSARLL